MPSRSQNPIARRGISPAKFITTNQSGETLVLEYQMGKIRIKNASTGSIEMDMEYHQPDEKDSTMSGEQATYLLVINGIPDWRNLIGEGMVRNTLAEMNNAEKVFWEDVP